MPCPARFYILMSFMLSGGRLDVAVVAAPLRADFLGEFSDELAEFRVAPPETGKG